MGLLQGFYKGYRKRVLQGWFSKLGFLSWFQNSTAPFEERTLKRILMYSTTHMMRFIFSFLLLGLGV